jgi:hypothetical protein
VCFIEGPTIDSCLLLHHFFISIFCYGMVVDVCIFRSWELPTKTLYVIAFSSSDQSSHPPAFDLHCSHFLMLLMILCGLSIVPCWGCHMGFN